MFTYFSSPYLPLAYGDLFFLTNDMANCRQEDCQFYELEGFCSLVNSLELVREKGDRGKGTDLLCVCSMLDLEAVPVISLLMTSKSNREANWTKP